MEKQCMDGRPQELEWLEFRYSHARGVQKAHLRRLIQAYKRHQGKCPKVDLESVDPFGAIYKCRTCGGRAYSSRYLMSGMSVAGSGRTKSGKVRAGADVLDTFTGVWHTVGKDGTVPHDNRCSHCGQDMSVTDPERAAERFDPKSPAG